MKRFFGKISAVALSLFLLLVLTCLTAYAEDMTEAATDASEEIATEAVIESETEADTTYETPWQCPDCALINDSGRYCTACKLERPAVTTWLCEHKDDNGKTCGTENNGTYCQNCGATRPETKVEVTFHPEKFVENLKFMAAGMVGIFLVIGVIILTIVLLGKLTAPRKKDTED